MQLLLIILLGYFLPLFLFVFVSRKYYNSHPDLYPGNIDFFILLCPIFNIVGIFIYLHLIFEYHKEDLIIRIFKGKKYTRSDDF